MSNKILETLKKILIYQFHYVHVFRKSNNILSRRRPTEAVRKAYFPAAELLDGKEEHKWLNILHKNHRRPHKGSRIRLEVHFFDCIIGLKGLQVSRCPLHILLSKKCLQSCTSPRCSCP